MYVPDLSHFTTANEETTRQTDKDPVNDPTTILLISIFPLIYSPFSSFVVSLSRPWLIYPLLGVKIYKTGSEVIGAQFR